MFGTVDRTPQDIPFQVFGIPCRIHPYFWLTAIYYGWMTARNVPGNEFLPLMVMVIACLFVSILVHELGHAVLIRWAGFRPEIVLHAFGGYAVYIPHRTLRPAMSIAISFAGPLAGFLLYGLTLLVEGSVTVAYQGQVPFLMRVLFSQMEWINLYWGLVNLLPIYPLDGGQITRSLLQSRFGTKGLRLSLIISIVASGATAWYMYQVMGYPVFSMAVLLFGMLCIESIQAYQSVSRGQRW